jgi:hypothetical protein
VDVASGVTVTASDLPSVIDAGGPCLGGQRKIDENEVGILL